MPKRAKAIWCKWVYKTKKDSLGNIEYYNSRLVTKRFTPKKGTDYNETFSPISKEDSFHIIMVFVAHFNLELHQMGVTMASLNKDQEEKLYIKKIVGLFSCECENLICKLKKSIYSLKSASRCGI